MEVIEALEAARSRKRHPAGSPHMGGKTTLTNTTEREGWISGIPEAAEV